MNRISVVINTCNEEETIKRALASVSWADEVIVCDMHSTDGTVNIAKKFGAKVVFHKQMPYVEPARNFAISKASNEWILIIDPDEEVPVELVTYLNGIEDNISFVKIARKNVIFGHWMKAAMWWPDYNIRFFKKGEVTWTDKIHRPPLTRGEGLELPAEENLSILHNHYTTVSQFTGRMDRYTAIQAKELTKGGYNFNWQDLVIKPLGEFLGRYFARRGFEDGLHGLSLSLLQSFSFFIMYLKVWEMEKFPERAIDIKELKELKNKSGHEIDYWFKYGNLSKNPLKYILQKAKNRF